MLQSSATANMTDVAIITLLEVEDFIFLFRFPVCCGLNPRPETEETTFYMINEL